MKKFGLICEQHHQFEGWFKDAKAIENQIHQGLLDCPYCGSRKLHKTLSAPNLSTPKMKARHSPADSPISPSQPPQSDVPSQSTDLVGMRMALRQIQKKIETDFTNVGDRFAEEVRNIHHGVSEEKNIFGTCTDEERSELSDEGVEITALPWLPPEH